MIGGILTRCGVIEKNREIMTGKLGDSEDRFKRINVCIIGVPEAGNRENEIIVNQMIMN